jgi:hypothetical protein
MEEKEIPEDWIWIKEIFDEAHLPQLGLPARWTQTQAKHMLEAFDPDTKKTINVNTEKAVKHKTSPVGFITSTSGKNPMPGSIKPAAVRYTRFMMPELNEHIVEDANGEKLAPCIVHGDYVQVEALQADHLQAKEIIMKRQKELVERLNKDEEFAAYVFNLPGIEKFFVKIDNTIFGTLFYYELYFNDIDNIWLICEACNLHKSNKSSIPWLKGQWLYGEEFFDYLGNNVNNERILTKTQDGKGLAEVAIQWFWDRLQTTCQPQKSFLKMLWYQ